MNKSIQFSAHRQLDRILYNVAFGPVFSSFDTERTIDPILTTKKYKTIINLDEPKIISVVSSQYQLISNQEALNLGKKAFTKLFQISDREIHPFNVITNNNLSSCRIDLIHQDVNFDLWNQDTWLPFLRVQNSYNKTAALTFELGFVRKLCSNGVLMDKESVTVKYYHTKRGIPAEMQVDVSRMSEMKDKFVRQTQNLARFYVKKNHVYAIISKALALKNLESNGSRFEDLRRKTNELTNKYYQDLEPTAYAVFNVLTDIISHQDTYRNIPGFALNPDRFYHMAAQWMTDFTLQAEERNFDMNIYLGRYQSLT